MIIRDHDTIAAPATAAGGAIAVIRLSGNDALTVCDRIFRGRQPLCTAAGYTVHYGRIVEPMPVTEEEPRMTVGQRTADNETGTAGPDGLEGSAVGITSCAKATCAEPGSQKKAAGKESAPERIVDDVLATVFRAPHSYTGEDSVEISCHGSQYIAAEILRLLTDAGARMAEPGEFTIRAYLNGKMDLSQAEAVADLIASSSRAAHALAANQMRGGYSEAFDGLRERLLNLASLLELELDFSEEEVEFADRTQLRETMERIAERIDSLRDSFSLGNVLKQGVAVAIAGAPNVGKSTLLNRLLNEERALVSDIAGTTRDVIEETANIDGVLFRFLDTAGIRSTDDRLERMGIERTLSSISRARIVVCMLDAAQLAEQERGLKSGSDSGLGAGSGSGPDLGSDSGSGSGSGPGLGSGSDSGLGAGSGWELGASGCRSVDCPTPDFHIRPDQQLLVVANKIDTLSARNHGCGQTEGTLPANDAHLLLPEGVIGISAKNGDGIDDLRAALRAAVDTETLYHGDAVVSNSRHYEALTAAREALCEAIKGLQCGLPTDLLSEEIRQVIRHIGLITGRGLIAPDEILQNIFSKFCVGK